MRFGLWICDCGKIHVFPMEKVDTAVNTDKKLVVVCNGCGTATIIGTLPYEQITETKSECYKGIFSCVIDPPFSVSEEMVVPKWGKVSEIIFNKGFSVPMKSGGYATFYHPSMGFDDNKCPSIIDLQDSKTINDYLQNRFVVDMERFIEENSQHSEILAELALQNIPGLNWSNTPYATKPSLFVKGD